ncbi:hypothetical protein NL676_035498 [Syzygium grande]|nr:hypothetical protein NL676_035498 [Syzygium grande]
MPSRDRRVLIAGSAITGNPVCPLIFGREDSKRVVRVQSFIAGAHSHGATLLRSSSRKLDQLCGSDTDFRRKCSFDFTTRFNPFGARRPFDEMYLRFIIPDPVSYGEILA